MTGERQSPLAERLNNQGPTQAEYDRMERIEAKFPLQYYGNPFVTLLDGSWWLVIEQDAGAGSWREVSQRFAMAWIEEFGVAVKERHELVLAVMEAALGRWNALYPTVLATFGLRLVQPADEKAFVAAYPATIMAPRPATEGEPYPYPSYIVPAFGEEAEKVHRLLTEISAALAPGGGPHA